jgi:hypothetical protein
MSYDKLTNKYSLDTDSPEIKENKEKVANLFNQLESIRLLNIVKGSL